MASNDVIVDWSDLTTIVNELDQKERERQDLTENSDKVLVDTIRIRSKNLVENVNFDSIKRVSHFWIDGQQNYKSSKPLPKLNLPENSHKLDVDLEIGFDDCFDNNGLIDDYYEYRDAKWKYYLKTLKDDDLLAKHKAQFVSFGGPIADILATVYDTSIDWIILAEKTNDVIYFFKSRNERFKGEYFTRQMHRRSYCGLKLLHLITDRDDNQLNENEKCFAINCISFESHKILSLNELDAIDDNNKAVDIKLAKRISSAKDQDFFVKKKLLRFWSKASVQGVDRILIGNTESNNYLLDIDERKVADIPEGCSHKWSDVKCINFLNRFFTFMKTCITEEKAVYEFMFRSGEEHIVCNRLHPRIKGSILPDSYTHT